MDISKIKLYLNLQMLAALAGIVLLSLFEFAGFYYYDAYYKMDVWASSRLFAGAVPSAMMILGIVGLVYAIYFAGKTLKTGNKTKTEEIQKNAKKSIVGGLVAAALAGIGGLVFMISSWDTYWWFGPGFYGGLIGGLAIAYLGRKILKKIKSS